VVPCYNEAARLDAGPFRTWLVDHPWVDLHFVDDGSTDDTALVLERLAGTLPRTTWQRQAVNGGKAEAVRQGVLAMLDRDDVRIVGFWDADLATPLDEVPRLAAPLREREAVRMVMGSRVKVLGHDIRRKPVRHYIGRIAATAASLVLRLPVYDTQCGAKLFRADDGTRRLFTAPFLTRWLFDVELLARLIHQYPDHTRDQLEAHVVEVPVRKWMDVADSRVTLTDVLRTPVALFTIWRALRPDKVGRR
jgi:glycosyltransferase involved in cell wall biosynthesis